MSEPTPHSPIRRFSSRREPLDRSFLADRLRGAKAYDRIAGYFSGSVLEVAGEALDTVSGPVRIVCNSGLRPQDVATARAAEAALRYEWCCSHPESLVETGGEAIRTRFSRLQQLLRSGKLQVKVLPDQHFGLVHGKAGVITLSTSTRPSSPSLNPGQISTSLPTWQKGWGLRVSMTIPKMNG